MRDTAGAELVRPDELLIVVHVVKHVRQLLHDCTRRGQSHVTRQSRRVAEQSRVGREVQFEAAASTPRLNALDDDETPFPLDLQSCQVAGLQVVLSVDHVEVETSRTTGPAGWHGVRRTSSWDEVVYQRFVGIKRNAEDGDRVVVNPEGAPPGKAGDPHPGELDVALE